MQVEAEAKQIAEDSKRLLETNRQLLADMQNRRIQLEDLLNRAESQQQQVLDSLNLIRFNKLHTYIIFILSWIKLKYLNVIGKQVDGQMANMNEFKAKANNAVTTGNAVLQDAERTLKTLQGK